MKNLLIIGGQDFTVKCLEELNVTFTIIQKKELITEYQLRVAHQYISIDYENVELTEKLCLALHNDTPFDAVVSFTELGLSTCAHLSEVLGIPTNCSNITVPLTKDKYQMRIKLDDLGVDNIPHALVYTEEDILHFMEENNYSPIILKPCSSAGSLGIYRIKDTKSVSDAYNHTKSICEPPYLAEIYIDGPEYSIESISKDGVHELLAITEKLTSGAPYFVETGHVQPGRVSDTEASLIREKVVELLNAVEHMNGPCHTEVKLSNGKVYIIETQTRNGGDNIWDMTFHTTGADLFKETICHLLNLEYQRITPEENVCMIKFYTPDTKPENSETYIEKLKMQANVHKVEVNDLANFESMVTSSWDRYVSVMLVANNHTDLFNSANHLFDEELNKNIA